MIIIGTLTEFGRILPCSIQDLIEMILRYKQYAILSTHAYVAISPMNHLSERNKNWNVSYSPILDSENIYYSENFDGHKLWHVFHMCFQPLNSGKLCNSKY